MFYYSGHGGQSGEQNYLLPVEFQAVDEEAILPRVAYPMSEIRDLVERAGARVRLLVFDACRTASLVNGKDIGGGLREITGQPEGTLIAYASAHNQIARFTPGARNSAYTAALLAELRQAGGSLKEKLEAAQVSVFRATGGKQAPYLYGFLSGPVFLGTGGPAPVRTVVEPPTKTEPTAINARINPKDGLNYILIPPGSFQMGCSPGDKDCRDNESPAHPVSISRGFYLGQTEVTQAAYKKVTSANPSGFKGSNLPVEQVSQQDAAKYCSSIGGRLPTEAEWEYAARGGLLAARYGALDEIAWYRSNSGSKTHPVATKKPNAYGLYDMLGNVWEWTSDWYGDYSSASQTDPKGATSGTAKALRGGSWGSIPTDVRSSFRNDVEPGVRRYSIGFRCLWE